MIYIDLCAALYLILHSLMDLVSHMLTFTVLIWFA